MTDGMMKMAAKFWIDHGETPSTDALAALLRSVRDEEREACAALVESHLTRTAALIYKIDSVNKYLNSAAAEIREQSP